MTTRIELQGNNYEFSISEITKTKYEMWVKNGFPEEGSSEYDEFLDLQQNTFESGLIPDNSLILKVNEIEIEKLHSKIAIGKNFHLSSYSYKFEKGKFYLATTTSHSAIYSLMIDDEFDFNKLRWNVIHFQLGKHDSQDLLTVEYGDLDVDYEWGGGSYMSDYLIKG